MDGNTNGSGNGHDHDNEDNHVIHFPSLAEGDRIRREQEEAKKPSSKTSHKEQLINLPPFTKFAVLGLIGIYLITEFVLTRVQLYWVFTTFGFVPGKYTGYLAFDFGALISPITYNFLHGGPLHIAMNALMLLAFGAGLEKWMGAKKLVIFFLGCSFAGILAHLALNWGSSDPVIGASAGLSGMFAAILLMMKDMNERTGMGGRIKIMPFILIWIGISVIFGMTGAPDGSFIAWAAHIGGFLAGLVLYKPVIKYV